MRACVASYLQNYNTHKEIENSDEKSTRYSIKQRRTPRKCKKKRKKESRSR